MTVTASWQEAQRGEAAWWGTCVNTYQEETKQRELFAPRLQLEPLDPHDPAANGKWPVYDLDGASVIDIGGGPASILLKCINVGEGSAVLDPCPYPAWTWGRYREMGLRTIQQPAEALTDAWGTWDEAWIYNVLQHVHDPADVIARAARVARQVRVVEWLDITPDAMHPHRLTAAAMDEWLGVRGHAQWIEGSGATLYHGRIG